MTVERLAGETDLAAVPAWRTDISAAPEDTIVDTKIDDEHGCRNMQPLRRRGSLWWTPDGVMYVYYRPTHWRAGNLAEAA